MPSDPTAGYQLHVSLDDVEPPVWRRLVVPGNWSLGAVHEVIQIAMGWTNSHIHQFETNKGVYGFADEDSDLDELPESEARLGEVLGTVGDRMTYLYDFGDGWTHEVVVEDLVAHPVRARCIDGARACPPEDCGGEGGYADLLVALADPDNPEHAELVEWLGPGFDPERFSATQVDAALATLE